MSNATKTPAAANSITTRNAAGSGSSGEMVDVLYQKMGNRWFAFSLIDDEVFFGSLTEEEIAAAAPAESISSNDASLVDTEATPSRRQRGRA